MRVLFLDIETLYSDEYSLRKMSPAEYILDPRFQLNGCAFKHGLDGVPFWVDGLDVGRFLASIDKENTLACSHNALFDFSALAWRYNFIPKLVCCTMSIAQATRRYALPSVSLQAVARHLGLGVKGDMLINVKGMNLPAIKAAGLYENYKQYAINDIKLCASIFEKLVVSGEFPMSEIPILDMTLRMTLQPSFVLDHTILHLHLNNVLVAKQRALDMVGADIQAMRQDETFANMLRSHGVEPPTKISPATGKTRYAFAKTDEAFLELQEHEDLFVQALVSARLGAKSTIEETRAQRFINISNLYWPTPEGNFKLGKMPMPIRFSGAHTHRCSGDWKLNVQNLGRGSELRRALRAPPGHKVIVIDSSQIEARLVAFLAGQDDLLEQFERGDDIYSDFASSVYGFPVNKVDHKNERFCGKTAILGCGFGMGWAKFQKQIKVMSKNQLGQVINLDDVAAVGVINTYRSRYSKIRALWRELSEWAIPILANGERAGAMMVGPVRIEKGMAYIPGRLKLFYHDLQYKDNEWVFTFAGKPKRLYGGKLLENIVQYLDRIVVFDAAARIQQRLYALGLQGLAQQAHDENAYVVPDKHVDQVKIILMEEMTKRPDWGLRLPLMAEIGVGDSYGEAK